LLFVAAQSSSSASSFVGSIQEYQDLQEGNQKEDMSLEDGMDDMMDSSEEINKEFEDSDSNYSEEEENPLPVEEGNSESSFEKFNYIFYFLYKYKYDNAD